MLWPQKGLLHFQVQIMTCFALATQEGPIMLMCCLIDAIHHHTCGTHILCVPHVWCTDIAHSALPFLGYGNSPQQPYSVANTTQIMIHFVLQLKALLWPKQLASVTCVHVMDTWEFPTCLQHSTAQEGKPGTHHSTPLYVANPYEVRTVLLTVMMRMLERP